VGAAADLREALAPDAFLDLNHLAYNRGELIPALADAVAVAAGWAPGARRSDAE
jgi:hypothetical protein